MGINLEKKIKKYKEDFNQAKITFSYLHERSSEEVLIQTFNHKEDRFWNLKINGLTVRQWNTKDIVLWEVIHYANSLIEATM